MSNSIFVRDVLDGYLQYARKKYFDKNFIVQLEIYMDYLCLEGDEYNLLVKRECEMVEAIAIHILRGSKKEYSKLKATKVERGKFFNAFVDYLKFYNKGSRVKLEKIPFVMNDLERKLDLVKHYKDYYLSGEFSAEDIANKYYVDEKTIRNDKREIKDGTLCAFGQKIDLEYDERNKSFYSTPVPIFMVQNITQILTILNGLGEMYGKKDYQQYALISATTIWQQLTDSVKRKIMFDLMDLLKLDRDWYGKIEETYHEHTRGFYPEQYMDNHEYNILRLYKNEKNVNIDVVYALDDEIIQIRKVHILEYEKDYIVVTGNRKIYKENIIKIYESGN